VLNVVTSKPLPSVFQNSMFTFMDRHTECTELLIVNYIIGALLIHVRGLELLPRHTICDVAYEKSFLKNVWHGMYPPRSSTVRDHTRCFVSLKIWSSNSRSFEMTVTPFRRACLRRYYYFMPVSRLQDNGMQRSTSASGGPGYKRLKLDCDA